VPKDVFGIPFLLDFDELVHVLAICRPEALIPLILRRVVPARCDIQYVLRIAMSCSRVIFRQIGNRAAERKDENGRIR